MKIQYLHAFSNALPVIAFGPSIVQICRLYRCFQDELFYLLEWRFMKIYDYFS